MNVWNVGGKARAELGQETGQRARCGGAGTHRRTTLTRTVQERTMLSSSPSKIHEPLVTGVSPRPAHRRQRQETAKHECTCGCREPCHRHHESLISAFATSGSCDHGTQPAKHERPRGLSTHLSAARPGAELAGATRPIRRSEGRRESDAPSRGRRAGSTHPCPMLTWVDRAFLTQWQAAAQPAAPTAARVSRGDAAGTSA
jgi:hypothetical protein